MNTAPKVPNPPCPICGGPTVKHGVSGRDGRPQRPRIKCMACQKSWTHTRWRLLNDEHPAFDPAFRNGYPNWCCAIVFENGRICDVGHIGFATAQAIVTQHNHTAAESGEPA